jgi:hypothetical protein
VRLQEITGTHIPKHPTAYKVFVEEGRGKTEEEMQRIVMEAERGYFPNLRANLKERNFDLANKPPMPSL